MSALTSARNSPRVSGLVAEHAEHAARDEVGAALVDAAADHAMVGRLDHHRHALGIQHLLDRVGDLRGQALLDLQPLGEDLDHPRELRDADHPLVGDIADPGAPDDRRDVMLAMALEGDAAQHDHLVIAVDLGEGLAQHLLRILVVAGEIFAEGAPQPVRRLAQAVAVGVLADPLQHRAERVLDLRVADIRDAGVRCGAAFALELAIHAISFLFAERL